MAKGAASKAILIERPSEGVVVMQLADRQGRNALSERLVDQLTEQLTALASDPEVKVVVLRGLPDVSCAGGVKEMLMALAHGEVAATDIMVTRALLEFPLPTIAAMEGHAVGGGLTLGVACDIVLMARESRYGCSFMNMGFTPGMGTTRLLQIAVGEHLAAEMMLGGRYLRGSRFSERSGINYVVPRDRLFHKALVIARDIADKPRYALELLKRSLSLPRRQAFEEARTSESMMHELCFAQPDIAQRIADNYGPPGGDS